MSFVEKKKWVPFSFLLEDGFAKGEIGENDLIGSNKFPLLLAFLLKIVSGPDILF